MLSTLLESKAAPTRRSGGTLISVGVHTAVIALAIAGTARAVAPPVIDRPHRDSITFVTPSPPNERRPRTERASQDQRIVVPAMERVLLPVLTIPKQLPPIDGTRAPVDPDIFGHATILSGGPPRDDRGLSSPTGSVYRPDIVDKAVVPLAGNPAPSYPAPLRSAQIEGEVVARFVVDTTGRVEPASISFPAATHPQFAEAVRQALLRSRYLAAMVGGRHVRQLVEQRFAFTLTR